MSDLNQHMRIAVDALSLLRGGGVVVAKRIVLGLVDNDIYVDLLVSREIPEFDLESNPRVKVHLIPGAEGVRRVFLFRWFRLDRFCNSIGAEAIISFNYYSSTRLPQLTYHINVIPFIRFRDSSQVVGAIKAVAQKVAARSALKNSTVNVFESQYVMKLAMKTGVHIKKPAVVYTGVDTHLVDSREVSVPQGTNLVCITSGAVHKNNDEVINLIRLCIDIIPEIRLKIFGDPNGILASLSTINRMFVVEKDFVELSGYIPRDQLEVELRRAKALVTASTLESFYMVAVEAMARGCPAIVVDQTSARESVGDAGLLYSKTDLDAALQYLVDLQDPAIWTQRSEASIEWAEKFKETDCVQKFVELARFSLKAELQK